MDEVTIRGARVDDYNDLYDVLACPGVVRNTSQLPYVSLDRGKSWLEAWDPRTTSWSLRSADALSATSDCIARMDASPTALVLA
jgi:hypothetical protein